MTAAVLDHRVSTPSATLTAVAGRVLVAAGAIFGAANLFQWSVYSGLWLHPAALSLSWPLAVAAFLVSVRRVRRGGGEAARRVTGWSRLFILAQLGAALGLAGLSFWRGDWSLMLWTSPVGLSLYAVGWGLGAVKGGGRWMGGVALGATVSAAALTQLLGTPAQYLAYASALFAFVLIPGLVMAGSRKG